MTVADLTMTELYCVVVASASLFAFFVWAFVGLVTDTDRQLSLLGYAFLGIGALSVIVGPALYGAYILYSGLN